VSSDARPDQFQTTRRHHRVVLVTGPSGSGRTTAINALEDIGYQTISNLPLTLLPRLLEGPPPDRPLAIGLDVRDRDFSANAVIELIDRLSQMQTAGIDVLYLDCRAEVLLRRYSETRRRHPLAPAESAAEGVEREVDLLIPIRARADILIDTSELTPHDLREEMRRWFDTEDGSRLAVTVHSFSYKRGVPRAVDIVFDVRFLRNPYWEVPLRALDGTDPAVAAFVEADPRFAVFFEKVRELILFLLPAYRDEGKSHLAIGFGCTGGQHRSVAIAIRMANALAAEGWQVSIRHRELERRNSTGPATGQGAGAGAVSGAGT
jgi:UPF0042 nucleotide-binding protein